METEQVTKLNDKTQWRTEEGRQTLDDPLLGCLLLLAKINLIG